MGLTFCREQLRLLGFVRFKGTRLTFEFASPVGAHLSAQQAAFVAALSKKTEIDYMCTKLGPKVDTFRGHIDVGGSQVQVTFDVARDASSEDIDAAFYTALRGAVDMDYGYLEKAAA